MDCTLYKAANYLTCEQCSVYTVHSENTILLMRSPEVSATFEVTYNLPVVEL